MPCPSSKTNLEFFSNVLAERFSEYSMNDGVFVPEGDAKGSGYAENFGVQWNQFQLTQFDSHTQSTMTRDRLFGCSKWQAGELAGKLVLEIGSGAGRFTEVLLDAGAHVVSVDMSTAVYANHAQNKSDRLLLIKESLYDLPLRPDSFDFVLCYGVAQHTPKPELTYQTAASFAKKSSGRVSIDHYLWRTLPNSFFHPKYFWRPLTARLPAGVLLAIVRSYIPIWFPIDTAIKSTRPGRLLSGLLPVPCWNYTGVDSIPEKDLVEWAVMDTYDALGAKYDKPWTLRRQRRVASTVGFSNVECHIGGNGLVMNGEFGDGT
jgi:SAM-dependent methyltransferase